jgi:hypothetical protein
MKSQRTGAGRATARGFLFLIASLCLGVVAPPAGAVTINSPLTLGDIFINDNNMANLSQIRGGSRVGGQIAYGDNQRISGLATDPLGNLYLGGNPGGTGITVERIGLGQNTSNVVLPTSELTGGTNIRDIAIAPDGTLYVLYTDTAAVEKFTPNNVFGYTRTPLGTLTGWTGNDLGSGHQLSLTPDGNFLVTSSRSQNRLWSMNTTSGAIQTWTTPTGTGPVTGTQLTASAESVLDPLRPNKILVPMGNDGLYVVDFDPLTGAFPNAAPTRLSNDATAAFLDAVTFDLAGNLVASLRDSGTIGSLRTFTEAQLVAAEGGVPFAIRTAPALYTAGDARIARDVIVSGIVPEPATAALLIVAASTTLLARRRA